MLPTCWARKKIFHFRSPKEALTRSCIMWNGQTYIKDLVVWIPQDFESMFGHFATSCMKRLNGISFTFLAYWITLGFHLIIVWKNCVKNLSKIKYVEFRIYALKDHLYFYKNSTNQTFSFICNKVIYFEKHFAP